MIRWKTNKKYSLCHYRIRLNRRSYRVRQLKESVVDRSVGRFGLLFISFLWLNANTFLYCHLPDINIRFNHSNIDFDQFQFEWNGICRNENSLRVYFSFSFFALGFFFTLNYHDGILSFIGSIVSVFHKTYKCRLSFQYIFHKSCVRTTKLLTRIN